MILAKQESPTSPPQIVWALLPYYTEDYGNGTQIILSTGKVIKRSLPLKQVLEEMARLYGKTIRAIRYSSLKGSRATSAPLTLDPLHTFVPLHVRTPIGRDGAYGYFNSHIILPHQVKATEDGHCQIILSPKQMTCYVDKTVNFVVHKFNEAELQHSAMMYQLFQAFQHPCNQRYQGIREWDILLREEDKDN